MLLFIRGLFMAKFDIKKIKIGNDKKGFSYILSISDVVADDNEEIIALPETFEGETITHIGYKQEHEEGGERFHDWHHPAQGMEYVEERYYASLSYFHLPKSVKKLVIPNTIKEANFFTFSESTHIQFIIDKDHPYLESAKQGNLPFLRNKK